MKKLNVNFKNYQFYIKETHQKSKLILVFDDWELLGYFWIDKNGKTFSLAITHACDFQVNDIIFIKNSTNWLDLF